jgi:hypothetical protein
MIALCRPHADKADHGSFTDEQLTNLKATGRQRAHVVRGQFEWMRASLLAVVGGNFYLDSMTILEIGSKRCIWFDRDEDGYLLLNFDLPTLAKRPRVRMLDNTWFVSPDVFECKCPPSGRLVEVNYHNGDRFKAEFRTIDSVVALDQLYPNAAVGNWSEMVTFPTTVVEITETSAGTSLSFTPTSTQIGPIKMSNCFFKGVSTVISVEATRSQLSQLFGPQPHI